MSAVRAPQQPDPHKSGSQPAGQDSAAPHLRLPGGSERAEGESPARQLQSHLAERLAPRPGGNAQRVMATLLILCLSCWLAGYWLVTSV
ncbi:MAG: hypothetical protein KDA53_05605 [Hyphomonas sp.]|nr:hypothetical protein [Hyphomonas sp.]